MSGLQGWPLPSGLTAGSEDGNRVVQIAFMEARFGGGWVMGSWAALSGCWEGDARVKPALLHLMAFLLL